MPLKSQAQRGWMWANKPAMAKRWEKETPKGPLPKHVQHKAEGGVIDEDDKFLTLDNGAVIAKAGLKPTFRLPGYPEKPQPVAPPAPAYQSSLSIPDAARGAAETVAGLVSPTSGSPGASLVAGVRSLLPGSPGYQEELTRYNEAAAPGVWSAPSSVMTRPGVAFANLDTEQGKAAQEELADRGMAVAAGAGTQAPSIAGPVKFYSALDRYVEGLKVNKMPADQWVRTLTSGKIPNLRAEELQARGVHGFLQDQFHGSTLEGMTVSDPSRQITKSEMLAYLQDHPMPVKMSMLGITSENDPSYVHEPMLGQTQNDAAPSSWRIVHKSGQEVLDAAGNPLRFSDPHEAHVQAAVLSRQAVDPGYQLLPERAKQLVALRSDMFKALDERNAATRAAFTSLDGNAEWMPQVHADQEALLRKDFFSGTHKDPVSGKNMTLTETQRDLIEEVFRKSGSLGQARKASHDQRLNYGLVFGEPVQYEHLFRGPKNLPYAPGTYREHLLHSPLAEPWRADHYEGANLDRGLVADMTTAEVTFPDGKKATHQIEGQSDLHQTGLDEGYANPGRAEHFTRRSVKLADDAMKAPPRASPYGNNEWENLNMKRLIAEAINNGHEYISWSDGATAADRWSALHRNVAGARYNANLRRLTLVDPDSHTLTLADDIKPDKLRLMFSKSEADALLDPGAQARGRSSAITFPEPRDMVDPEHWGHVEMYDKRNVGAAKRLLGKGAEIELVPATHLSEWNVGGRIQWQADHARDTQVLALGERLQKEFERINPNLSERVGSGIADQYYKLRDAGAATPELTRMYDEWREAAKAYEDSKIPYVDGVKYPDVQSAKKAAYERYAPKAWRARITPEVRAKIQSEGLPFAEGGEVPDMRETDTHFHVGSYRISKKGLNKPTAESIRQYLACGGKVQKPKQHLAGGEFVLPVPPDAEAATRVNPGIPMSAEPGAWKQQAPIDPVAVGQAAGAAVQQATSNPVRDLANQSAASAAANNAQLPGLMSGVGPIGAGGVSDEALQFGVQPAPEPPPLLAAPSHATGAPVPGSATGILPTHMPGAPVAGATPAPPRRLTAEEQYQQYTNQFSGPLALANQGLAEFGSAARTAASEKSAGMQLAAEVQRHNAEAQEKSLQDVNLITGKLRAQQQAMFERVANNQIDPRRFLNDRTTGERIMGAIGMVLSGAGSGLTGQPNLAVQVVQAAIDRDIAAQKTNLEKEQTLLGYNIQQTQNELAAAKFTQAALWNIYAARLEANKDQLAGQLAMPEALAQIANAKVQASQAQSQAVLMMQQAASNKINALMGVSSYQALQRLIADGHASPEDYLLYPENIRKQFVKEPARVPVWVKDPKTGQTVHATDEHGTPRYNMGYNLRVVGNPEFKPESVQAKYEPIGDAMAAMQAYKQFVAEHRGGSWDPGVQQQARIRAERLDTALRHVMTGEDKPYKNITEQITRLVTVPAGVGKAFWNEHARTIEEVEQILDARSANITNQYTWNNDRPMMR
jgi:hypothetical protein